MPQRGQQAVKLGSLGRGSGERGRSRALLQSLQAGLQLGDIQPHDLVRTVTSVDQALDLAQALHLVERVETLALGVAQRRGKAIATLPHAQQVLRQAGVAFDGGDAQLRRDLDGIHVCLGQSCNALDIVLQLPRRHHI